MSDQPTNVEFDASQLAFLEESAVLAGGATSVKTFFAGLSELLADACLFEHLLIWVVDSRQLPLHRAADAKWSKRLQDQVIDETETWLRQRSGAAAETAEPHQPSLLLHPVHPPLPALESQGIRASFLTLHGLDTGHLRVLAGYEHPRPNQDSGTLYFRRALARMLAAAITRIRTESGYISVKPQVLEAKHHWEATVDALPQLIAVLDESGRIIRINRTVEAWSLGSVDSSRDKGLHGLLHPQCESADCPARTHWEQLWKLLQTDDFGVIEFKDPDSGRELKISLARNRRQTSELTDQGYAFVVVEEVSAQQRAERALRRFHRNFRHQVAQRSIESPLIWTEFATESETQHQDPARQPEGWERYPCVVENTLTGTYLLKGNLIQTANARFAEIFGYSQRELKDLDIRRLLSIERPPASFTPSDADAAESDWLCDNKLTQGFRKDGSRIRLQLNHTRIDCHEEPLILGHVIDVTAQVEAERILRASEQELQNLSAQLLSAQEEERLRIAGELHDGIGQSLSVIKLRAESGMREMGDALSPSQRENFEGLIWMTRHAADEVRRISMDLRPSILDDLGLNSTIDWFCREYRNVFPDTELSKEVDFEEADLEPEQKVAVFRIVQEAFSNIDKHAAANRIDLVLKNANGSIRLSIKDNGKGFDSEQSNPLRTGFGLRSMKQRAILNGGEITIASRPGRGTTIEAVWPSRSPGAEQPPG